MTFSELFGIWIAGLGVGVVVGIKIGTYFTRRTIRTALDRQARSFEEASRFQ